MLDTYSYTPQNLVLARKVNVVGNKIESMLYKNIDWSNTGYVQARCKWPSLLPTTFRGLQIPHDHEYCNKCGMYGQFNLDINYDSKFAITILIETHGNVIIGNRLIARTQAAQVIAIVEKEEKFYSNFRDAFWDASFAELNQERPTFAQQYFDVPILTRTEAQHLIDQQAAVWGLSEIIADTRRQQDEKFLKAYIKAAEAILQVSKAMKETERSMVDFKAAITNIDPSINTNDI